jgi:hypothetical protein
MMRELVFFKNVRDKIPANAVKSFGKIHLEQESSRIPVFLMKGVNNFLSDDNVGGIK